MGDRHVLVHCDRCGDVRLPPENFAIYCFPSPEAFHQYAYSYWCSFCERDTHKPCSLRIYAMLGAEQVPAYVLFWPPELGEQHVGEPLGMADIRAAQVEMGSDEFNAEKAGN